MVNLTRRGVSKLDVVVTGPGGYTDSSIYDYDDRISTDSKVGQKNPHWKDQVRQSRQAGTPYSRSVVEYGFLSGLVTGNCRLSNAPSQRREETLSGQFLVGPGVPDAPSLAALDSSAKTNFLSKCRGSQRAFQGGVFLGELRESISMIVRPASALRRSFSRYSADAKKAFAKARGPNKAKAVSGTWLEYVFGWRPLFKDVDDGMAALADTSHLIPDVIVGYSKDEWIAAQQRTNFGAPGAFIRGNCLFSTRCSGSVRYLGCVAWESSNRAGGWQSHWGLTLSDFAPTIWELIPYSFLVDYFSNIGAIIDASSYGAVDLRWGVRSARSTAEVLLGNQWASWSSSSVMQADSIQSTSLGMSKLQRFTFNRSLVDKIEVGVSDIHFKIPGVGETRKWLNIAALAAERGLR